MHIATKMMFYSIYIVFTAHLTERSLCDVMCTAILISLIECNFSLDAMRAFYTTISSYLLLTSNHMCLLIYFFCELDFLFCVGLLGNLVYFEKVF